MEPFSEPTTSFFRTVGFVHVESKRVQKIDPAFRNLKKTTLDAACKPKWRERAPHGVEDNA